MELSHDAKCLMLNNPALFEELINIGVNIGVEKAANGIMKMMDDKKLLLSDIKRMVK